MSRRRKQPARRPDRNETPGLSTSANLDVTRCRQIVHHQVETAAVHSRSQGWLPMLKVDITTIPLAGPGPEQTLEFMIGPEDLRNLIVVLAHGLERAELDAEIGPR